MTAKLPPTDTGACGEFRGAARHERRGETYCQPCRDAYNIHRKARRPRKPPRPPKPPKPYREPRPNAAEVAAEIEFFLRCGEGTHAIIKALGYQQNPHSLKQRLRDNGRKDLNQALFGEAA